MQRRTILDGCRILVTRPREQSKELCDRIEALGGETVIFPMIRIVDPVNFAPLDDAIRNLSSYDWLVFTSANGVKRFFQRMALILGTLETSYLQDIQVAAIGPKTAQAIEQYGLTVDLVPTEYRAEALLAALKERVKKNDRLLLPRADIARNVLPDGLRNAGCLVTDVDAYRVIRETDEYEQVIDSFAEGHIDIVTFTSPSAVKSFVKALNETGKRWMELLDDVAIACIGPITGDSVRELIREPDIEALDYTIEGLITAIIDSRICTRSKREEDD